MPAPTPLSRALAGSPGHRSPRRHEPRTARRGARFAAVCTALLCALLLAAPSPPAHAQRSGDSSANGAHGTHGTKTPRQRRGKDRRRAPKPARPAPANPAAAAADAEASLPARYRELLDKTDAITAEVIALRGLAVKRPIQRGIMQKAEIEARLRTRIDEEYSPEELAAEELALKRLGLLPAKLDYKKLVIELLTEQIAGFYDPVEGQLFIAGWQDMGLGPGADDMVMAHELVHALQDQHFDLERFMKPDKHQSDAAMARQALVEGDGTALMLEHTLSRANLPPPWHAPNVLDLMKPQMTADMDQGALGRAPLVLRENMLFPYLAGLSFVAHFRQHHSWQRIDAIFRKPPLSSEHILHPESYERYERPVAIAAAPLPSLAGYAMVYHDVVGEFGLGVLLRQHLGAGKPSDALRDKTERAAEGWGGDRLAIFAPPGHTGAPAQAVAVLYTVWDETADALEYFDALSDALPALASGGKPMVEDEDKLVYADAGGALHMAERRDDAVLLLLGAPRERAPELAREVWKRWKLTRVRPGPGARAGQPSHHRMGRGAKRGAKRDQGQRQGKRSKPRPARRERTPRP